MISTHPLLYSAHLCCSVDYQGQGKAQRFTSQVQHRTFLASQQNTLDELVDFACLAVDRGSYESTFGDSFRKTLWALLLGALKAPTSPMSLVD